jgi:hypothetical protein
VSGADEGPYIAWVDHILDDENLSTLRLLLPLGEKEGKVGGWWGFGQGENRAERSVLGEFFQNIVWNKGKGGRERGELLEKFAKARGWIFVISLGEEYMGEGGGGGEGAFEEAKSFDGEQAKLFATFDRKGARKFGDEVRPVRIGLGRIHLQIKEMG